MEMKQFSVLVLCGYKLYFSIYHPMHTAKTTVLKSNNFVGFECSEEDTGSDQGEESDQEHRLPHKVINNCCEQRDNNSYFR